MAPAPSVLITGGSGYFGARLLRLCLEQGSRCRIFDLHDASDRPAGVEFVRGDIRDRDAVTRACVGVDVIHHNVAQVPLAKNRELFQSVIVDGTRYLLAAARDAGVRKIVFTSSSAVYGAPRQNPITEESPRLPAEPYGRAKLEAERLCEEQGAKGTLDITIVRPRTILGHGRLGIFQILFEWVREGRNIPVLGKGDNLYQFIHADDLAEACILAGSAAGAATYNVGTDRFGSMRSLLEGLCAHAGTGSRVRSVPFWPAVLAMKATSALRLSPLAPYHALMYGRSMYFDIGRATTALGWRPRYSNDEMIRDSFDWYLAHRDEVLSGATGSRHRSAVKQGVLAVMKRVL
jgi:nucleoside-diphosphate-sugar epimerase